MNEPQFQFIKNSECGGHGAPPWHCLNCGAWEDKHPAYCEEGRVFLYGKNRRADDAESQGSAKSTSTSGGARVYLAAVIEAYDDFAGATVEIDLFPMNDAVEEARQYLIDAR